MTATTRQDREHPSLLHPIGMWRETTYGDWGSRTVTRCSCLNRDCGWSETRDDSGNDLRAILAATPTDGGDDERG